MKAVYIGRYYMEDSHNLTLSSISMPITKRKHIKEEIKSISKNEWSFSDINQENVRQYYETCRHFINNSYLEMNVLNIVKYHRSMYCKLLFKMIEMEYLKNNKEELRVYIPAEYDKTFLKSLIKMAKKSKMKVDVEEIKYSESVFQQFASVIAGCSYYHNRDDLYFENLGKTSQAQLVAYLYTAKKSKNKMNIFDYETIKKKSPF